MKTYHLRPLVFLFLLASCIILLGGCGAEEKVAMKLKGEEEITLSLNEEYSEQGTNIEDCTIDGSVDSSKEGEYTITYTYEDQTLTRTVRVVDPDRVTVTLNGCEDTYVKEGDPYIESNCHVIDQKDGNLTDQVKISGEVDTDTPGDYEITYTVTNSAGYTSKTVRNVHVVAKDEFQDNTSGVPVLMYHYVYTEDDAPEVWNNNYIKDTDLAEELAYLQEENYYYPSWEELRAYIDGKISLPEKSVVLTFDDGRSEFLKHGIPVLEKYKVPATSFVIAKNSGEKKVKKYASPYVSFQSHSYGMHTGGSGIGHGGIIFAMTKDEIVADLQKCQSIVQNTEAFAYPYGDVSDDGIAAVEEAGFLCAFNTHNGKVKPGDNPYNLTRVRVCGDYSLAQFKAITR
jgi:peptidoglycan/xylan/chitin deacetylase (PgdA/CDA1 family)